MEGLNDFVDIWYNKCGTDKSILTPHGIKL